MRPKTPTHLAHLIRLVDCFMDRKYNDVETNTRALIEALRKDGEEQIAARFERVLGRRPVMKFERLPTDRDSGSNLVEHEGPSSLLGDVFLNEDTEVEVQRFLRYWRKSDQIIRAGLTPPATVLVWGPPGVGKTMLARHLAVETGLPLLTCKLGSTISSYMGSTGKNIQAIFETSGQAPCVLFLDEFDALAKERGDKSDIGESYRIVINLLQNIDRMPVGSVLVAATNHEKLLDRAVWRRFAFRIPMRLPDVSARRQMLESWLNGWGLAPLEMESLVLTTEGMTGAQIREAVSKALLECVVNDRPAVPLSEVEVELRAVRTSYEAAPMAVQGTVE